MHDRTAPEEARTRMEGAPRLTNRATAVLAEAATSARRLRHDAFDTEHLLLGIVAEGTATPMLAELGVDADRLVEQLRAMIPPGRADTATVPSPSERVLKVLELAEAEALRADTDVGPEHMLVALIAAPEGLAPELLRRVGLTVSAARLATTEKG